MLANATTLCILSPISLFLVSTFNNGLAIAVACTILLGMVALAVFIFVKTGIKLSHLQYLEQEPFETEYGVTGLVKEKNQSYQEHYSFSLACGVVLCILSVIPLIIAGCMEASDYVCTLCLAVLLILVSIGVNILIRVSTIKVAMIHCCKKVIIRKRKACKEENGNIHRCVLVSCDSYLSWLELMDQAMGYNLYDLACCCRLICSHVWNC